MHGGTGIKWPKCIIGKCLCGGDVFYVSEWDGNGTLLYILVQTKILVIASIELQPQNQFTPDVSLRLMVTVQPDV